MIKPLEGGQETPLPNGVPRSGSSVDSASVEPLTTRTENGGGAGTAGTALADARDGRQQMGDGARIADARSLPEF